MKISSRGLYALKALTHLAEAYEGGLVKIHTVAEEEQIPEKFLEGILVALKNARIVASQRGSISIDATAVNAEVRIDGQLVGTVPLANIPLPAGRHSIQVKKKGFKVWQEEVVILPDAASHLTADLEPAPESK